MSKAVDLKRLNRVLCYALRHAPEALGLTVDDHGAVSVTDLLCALRSRYPVWRTLDAQHLDQVVSRSSHQRFEIASGRIRALYGHSAAVRRTATAPPTRLYHGTSAALLERILRDGLKPMRRTHVQLTTSTIYARRVVKAQDEPVVLTVHAVAASLAGVSFFKASALVWLSEPIPPAFLTAGEIAGGPKTPDGRRELVRELFEHVATAGDSTR